MCEVIVQNVEPSSTRKATKRMIKILDITYVKAELKQVVDNATQLNAEKRTKLLSILKECKDLFDGTLGDWATDTVELNLKPGSKLFNVR